MVRLLQLDLEGANTDIDPFNLEESGTVELVGSCQLKPEVKPITSEEDIGNTSIGNGWKPLLLLYIVADIYPELL